MWRPIHESSVWMIISHVHDQISPFLKIPAEKVAGRWFGKVWKKWQYLIMDVACYYPKLTISLNVTTDTWVQCLDDNKPRTWSHIAIYFTLFQTIYQQPFLRVFLKWCTALNAFLDNYLWCQASISSNKSWSKNFKS